MHLVASVGKLMLDGVFPLSPVSAGKNRSESVPAWADTQNVRNQKKHHVLGIGPRDVPYSRSICILYTVYIYVSRATLPYFCQNNALYRLSGDLKQFCHVYPDPWGDDPI